jgi:hypothetical protein
MFKNYFILLKKMDKLQIYIEYRKQMIDELIKLSENKFKVVMDEQKKQFIITN